MLCLKCENVAFCRWELLFISVWESNTWSRLYTQTDCRRASASLSLHFLSAHLSLSHVSLTDRAGGVLLQLNDSLTVFVPWCFVCYCVHLGYSSHSYPVWKKKAAAAVAKVTVKQIVYHTDKSSKFANRITLTFAFLLYLRDFFIDISVSFPLVFKNLSLYWTSLLAVFWALKRSTQPENRNKRKRKLFFKRKGNHRSVYHYCLCL